MASMQVYADRYSGPSDAQAFLNCSNAWRANYGESRVTGTFADKSGYIVVPSPDGVERWSWNKLSEYVVDLVEESPSLCGIRSAAMVMRIKDGLWVVAGMVGKE